MSSLKMTFSLASLVVLIAFGLVFIAAPAIAHNDPDVRSHTHPLKTDLPAQDLNDDDDTTDVGEGAVTIHNSHPVGTITLKAAAGKVKGSEVVIAADDNDAANGVENQFTLIVDFDQDVVGDATTRSVDAAVPLGSQASFPVGS